MKRVLKRRKIYVRQAVTDDDDGCVSYWYTGREYGTTVTTTKVDVSDAEQVDVWLRATSAKFGQIDAAANIAGIAGGAAELTESIVSVDEICSVQKWRWMEIPANNM